ncbi:MAG: PH domain-containing protein [Prolixibacteraceae bacterium]|jgi:putative membrane protein|nr:PH domain-containing protein [Prolixibacteraceae bacterium]MBT6005852.1 PH domain-containing protein [Prolixibacteraceae bacterium]MBT6764689.1 PH domain-containing protein [Prolixibacteraceae bacterium]MBT6999826.1 PH domain-containing protein [Prolixibacteraceae bacterium]MBT7397184.1 PH domain-containing protein [Prolixibacteraceae bacterium]
MNKMDLTKPTRQSVKGLALIFIQGIRQSVRMFWPLVLMLVIQKEIFANNLIWLFIGIAIFILLIIHSILFYLNFYFYVSGEEFILKKGYFRKKILTIPLDRIQSVNTKQNLIQQLLNVESLEIDTAGSAGKELKIHALEKAFAAELQNKLRSGKANFKSKDSNDEVQLPETEEELILKLEPVDLLKIGISQNHFRTALIIVAFGFQIFQKVEEVFKEKAEEYSGEFFSFMSNSSWAIVLFLLIFFLIVSILFSLFRTVFKYFDFKLLKKGNAYRVEAGLLNKRNVIIPYNKIQELNWETGPIKKRFGIYNLVFKQAVSGQNRKVQLVDAPGCLTQHLETLKTDLFGEDKLSEINRIYSNNYYFRRLWFLSGWMPVIFTAPFLYTEIIYLLAAFLWFLGSAGFSLLILKKRYFKINNDQIRISKGAIAHKWKQMELFKIQSVEFRQTIFQKRRSLASLSLMNASGSMTIPYIDETMAKEIYNYLLYHTEISEKSWM